MTRKKKCVHVQNRHDHHISSYRVHIGKNIIWGGGGNVEPVAIEGRPYCHLGLDNSFLRLREGVLYILGC